MHVPYLAAVRGRLTSKGNEGTEDGVEVVGQHLKEREELRVEDQVGVKRWTKRIPPNVLENENPTLQRTRCAAWNSKPGKAVLEPRATGCDNTAPSRRCGPCP